MLQRDDTRDGVSGLRTGARTHHARGVYQRVTRARSRPCNLSRMRHLALCTAVLLSFAVSCGGSDTPKPDSGSGSGSAAACTGALYDSCNAASPNCMTGLM